MLNSYKNPIKVHHINYNPRERQTTNIHTYESVQYWLSIGSYQALP